MPDVKGARGRGRPRRNYGGRGGSTGLKRKSASSTEHKAKRRAPAECVASSEAWQDVDWSALSQGWWSWKGTMPPWDAHWWQWYGSDDADGGNWWGAEQDPPADSMDKSSGETKKKPGKKKLKALKAAKKAPKQGEDEDAERAEAEEEEEKEVCFARRPPPIRPLPYKLWKATKLAFSDHVELFVTYPSKYQEMRL